MGLLVHVIRVDAMDGPAGRFPRPLLSRVLTDIEVEGTTIDFDDETPLTPAQVGLISCDAHIQSRHRNAGGPQDLE